ncbi:hypothetical protein AU476_19835 [Cupriavidus sp. UYMSc13B]|nr:hypothetical protein AU476_19835 [Cupriavidus sp. UYMSc13B]
MMLNSGDTDGLRASERDHAVEHTRTDGHFGGLRPDFSCPQTVSCQLLRRYIRVSASERR